MAELDAFERRLADALLAYADEMPTSVDAAAVARRVAVEPGRHRARIPQVTLQLAPGLAWAITAMALLLALVGALIVGGALVERPSGSRIEVLTPGTGISNVVAGRDGFIWFTRQGKLLRLDPASRGVRTWDLTDDVAFLNPTLAPAQGDGVWLTGAGGLRRFDGQRFGDVIAAPTGVTHLDYVAEGSDGTVWASTEFGEVVRWDGRTWTEVPRGRSGTAAGPIAFDAAGRLWVSEMTYPGPMPEGVSRLDGTDWTTFTEAAGNDIPVVIDFAAEPGGAMWMGTESRLLRFDDVGWRSYGSEELGAGVRWSPVVDLEGVVWAVGVADDRGLRVVRLDGDGWSSFGPEDGPQLRGWRLPSIATNRHGVFVGTDDAVYRLVDSVWERLWSAPDDATPPELPTLVALSADESWALDAGAWTGDVSELWHIQVGAIDRETIGDEPVHIFDIAAGPDGTLWAATDGGTGARLHGRWVIVDPRPARGVAVGPDGTAWIGGIGSAVWTIRRVGDSWARSDLPPLLDGRGTVVGPSMTVDQAGDLWVSGGQGGWGGVPGLYRFDGQRWEIMRPVEDSDRFVFGAMAVAPGGDVWVTFEGEGSTSSCCDLPSPSTKVARYDGREWTVYGTPDGLAGDSIGLSLAIAPDGTVWVGTTNALYRYDGDTWAVAFDVWSSNLSVAPDGSLWLSSGAGVVRIQDPGS